MSQQQYVVLDRDLVRGLSEKEVEIEHLRTQLTAMAEKSEILNDVKKDVEALNSLFKGSDQKRLELQVTFVETSQKVRQDTEQHQDYQKRLIQDNEKLRQELNEAR